MLLGYPTYFDNYVPELLAGFLGIFLALAIDRELRAREGQNRTIEIKTILREEIERMKTRAEGAKGNHLETQAWESLIRSGEVGLLEIQMQRDLFNYYARINAHNSDAATAMSAKIQARGATLRESGKKTFHYDLSRRILDKEKETLLLIQDILNKEYWKSIPSGKH